MAQTPETANQYVWVPEARLPCVSGFSGRSGGRYPPSPMTLFGSLARLVLGRLRWSFVTGDTRDAEILALRHQVRVDGIARCPQHLLTAVADLVPPRPIALPTSGCTA